MSPFSGPQKCRALICFCDPPYPFLRDRSGKLTLRRGGGGVRQEQSSGALAHVPRDGGAANADADQPVRLAAPSPRTVVRVVAIVVACAASLYLAWRLRDVLRLGGHLGLPGARTAPLVDAIDALLAIPVAAAVQIILRDWWANRSAAPAAAPTAGAVSEGSA